MFICFTVRREPLLWTHTRELLGSNVSWDAGCPGWGFPRPLQANVGTVPRLGHDHCLPNSVQFIIHLLSHHSTLV
jgi:hypothetical protein